MEYKVSEGSSGVGGRGTRQAQRESPLLGTAVSPFYRRGPWLLEARDLPSITRVRPRAVTQTQIGLAAGSTLFFSVALVPASVSPVLRELQISSRPPTQSPAEGPLPAHPTPASQGQCDGCGSRGGQEQHAHTPADRPPADGAPPRGRGSIWSGAAPG